VRTPKPRLGFSVVDLIVSVSILSVLLGATFFILKSSNTTWRKVSGEQEASGQLAKAEGWLRRDVALTAFGGLNVADSLSSLVGKDGDAIWFLSAIDPATGEFVRNEDGTPRWQRNILYYCVVPTGSNPTGFSGSGISDDEEYEVSHPGKVLVRKVIDVEPPTVPGDPLTQEELITDVSPYLEVPNDSVFSSDDAESVSIVGRNLLSFRAQADDALQRVSFILQAAKLEEQQQRFAVGSRSFIDPEHLLERRFESFPENVFIPSAFP
jgi:type II secretory pathway component PulJ